LPGTRLADALKTPPTFDFGLDASNRAEITRQLQAELADKLKVPLSAEPLPMEVS